ncbi:MAG: hypothetical protein HY866_18555, partial [Chloroflexi bacterium]|nr:hypothetical protein [Chloroflexota bacterium]
MRRDTFFVLIGLLAMVAGLVGLNQVTPRAAATNEAGPAAQAEPAHQNNTVWTVSDQTFQSNYPNGFEFGV